MERNLTVTEIVKLTGWSTSKVHSLIRSQKLYAIDTSSGKRASWEIPKQSLEAFFQNARNNGATQK